MRSVLLWTITIIITVSAMVYQRATGPTKPKNLSVELDGQQYKFSLPRTCEIGTPLNVDLQIADKDVEAIIEYKLYKTTQEWTTEVMPTVITHEKAFFGEGDEIEVRRTVLPEQAAAGKVEYRITLSKNGEQVVVNPDKTIVVRWKGFVPRYILIPHVLFMIMSLFFATRGGVEALFNGDNTRKFAKVTIIVLGMGGLVLGPIVQKYAFGDYWTGWPFGGDWTDNKTIVSWAFWVIAFIVLRKKPHNKVWPIIATLVLFTIYLIPHSMGGSELNNETGKVETGLKD